MKNWVWHSVLLLIFQMELFYQVMAEQYVMMMMHDGNEHLLANI